MEGGVSGLLGNKNHASSPYLELGSWKLGLFEFTCLTVLLTTIASLLSVWNDWQRTNKRKATEKKVNSYLKFRQLSQFLEDENILNGDNKKKKRIRTNSTKDAAGDKNASNSTSAESSSLPTIQAHPIFKGKKVLILVNPFSGRKESTWIFKHIAKPMLEGIGVKVDSIFTQHSDHAREIARTFDMEEYSCLACISGDGMLHQVLNGLADRVHIQYYKEHPQEEREGKRMDRNAEREALLAILKQITLVLIPGGTSNGIAAAFGTFDPFTAVKNLVEGKVNSVDLLDIIQPDRMKQPAVVGNSDDKDKHTHQTCATWWDIHAVSWALLGDYDSLVEVKLRWLGTTLRNQVAPAWLIFKKKSYRGRISFLPAEYPVKNSKYKYHRDPRPLENLSKTKHKATVQYIESACAQGDKQKGLSEFGDISRWKTIEDNFTLCVNMNLSHGASDAIFAPRLSSDEGCVEIVIMRKPSRWDLLKVFLQVGDGSQANHPQMEIYKARAFLIEPISTDSIMDISGELIPSSTTLVRVHQGAAKLIC